MFYVRVVLFAVEAVTANSYLQFFPGDLKKRKEKMFKKA